MDKHLNALKQRKKKRTSAIRDVRKERFAYNDYVERRSLLDHLSPDSELSMSPFKGILRLILLVAFVFVLNNLILAFYNNGLSSTKRMFISVLNQIKYGAIFWLLCTLWAHWSFVNHLLILKGMPFQLMLWVEYFQEHWLFLYVSYWVYSSEYLISTRCFMYFQICIHYFKMNSYFKMNRNYRETYLLEKQAKANTMSSSYPLNINYREFIRYMAFPVLTYQDTFPITSERATLSMIMMRLFLIFLALNVIYIVIQS